MRSPDESNVDWSGVGPDRSPIRPLDAETFLERIQLLSARARILTILRRAFAEQQFPRDKRKTATEAKDADIGSSAEVKVNEPTNTPTIDQ